jgi:hypothetical protein
MRKGRLIAAEIAGQGEKEFGSGQHVQVVGFRRAAEMGENR